MVYVHEVSVERVIEVVSLFASFTSLSIAVYYSYQYDSLCACEINCVVFILLVSHIIEYTYKPEL